MTITPHRWPCYRCLFMCCFSHRLKPLFQCALRLHGVPDFRGYGLLSFGTRPGVEGLKTSPSDTQNAGTHRFYRAVVAKDLPWMFLFRHEKKPAKSDTNHIQKPFFSCWLRRSNSLKQWMNKSFQFCFFVALWNTTNAAVAIWMFFFDTTRLPEQAAFLLPSATSALRSATIYGLSKWTADAAWVNSDKVLEYLNHPQNSFW